MGLPATEHLVLTQVQSLYNFLTQPDCADWTLYSDVVFLENTCDEAQIPNLLDDLAIAGRSCDVNVQLKNFHRKSTSPSQC